MVIVFGFVGATVFALIGGQLSIPSFSPTSIEEPIVTVPLIKPGYNDPFGHFSYYKQMSFSIIDGINVECSPYAENWYHTVGMTYYLANKRNNDQPTATYTTVITPTYHYGSYFVSYLYEDSKWSVVDGGGQEAANEEDIIKGALKEHNGIVYFEAIYDITKNEFGNHYDNISCLVAKQ